VRAFQILAARFVLDQQRALPQQVDVPVAAVELPDALLEARHAPARHAEDVEERVPEALGVRVLAFGVFPVAREGDRAIADLVPGQGHRGAAGGSRRILAESPGAGERLTMRVHRRIGRKPIWKARSCAST
jgi:hypothetical protein